MTEKWATLEYRLREICFDYTNAEDETFYKFIHGFTFDEINQIRKALDLPEISQGNFG